MTTSVEAVVDALGWALLHSTWQLSILAGLLWLGLRLGHRAGSTTRYALCVGALFAAPFCFATTAWLCWDSPASAASSLAVVSMPHWLTGPSLADGNPSLDAGGAATGIGAVWLPRMVSLWLLGMLGFGARFVGGFMHVRALQRRGQRPVSAALQARVRGLARSLGMEQAVAVVESFEVAVPMVVGILRPVILLPSSTLAGLRPDELEAVLLHELAHIRRRDLWVGFVQGLVEVVLFFHPAVWWISGRLRAERELCCDDAVLAGGMSARLYAGALLRLSEQRLFGAHSAAATDGSLRFRIERLVGAPRPPQRGVRGLAAALLFCGLGLASIQSSLATDHAQSANLQASETDVAVDVNSVTAGTASMAQAGDSAALSQSLQQRVRDLAETDSEAVSVKSVALESGRIEVTGVAASSASLHELLVRIEASPYFSDVALHAVARADSEGSDRKTFRFSAQVVHESSSP